MNTPMLKMLCLMLGWVVLVIAIFTGNIALILVAALLFAASIV